MEQIKQITGASRCPACGQDNSCAIANEGDGASCWCQSEDLDGAAIGQAFPLTDNPSCLCKNCARQLSQKDVDLER